MAKRRRRNGERVVTETLEVRMLLSATLSGGRLNVAGTNAADSIRVESADSNIRVTINGEESLFAAGDVGRIRVFGYGGDDVITIGSDVNARATLLGGDGNDRITGGPGRDRILGNRGRDTLNGGGKHDRLIGGNSHDLIYGGAGRDTLNGGGGNDHLVGGRGADALVDERGTNKLNQSGANAFWATGSEYVADALVHFIRPDQSNGRTIIMVPGHNLGSDIYLQTPDGREGWAQQFAAEGYDVYVINDPEYDFSRGFNIEGFKAVPANGAPPADDGATQTWADQDIWRRWGFGNREGNPYEDTRFPTDHFDTFEHNYPYVGTVRRNYADSITALLESVGPAVIMAHSAGGPQGVGAAFERPDLVSGLVLVEPTGPPTEDDFPVLSGISMLGVYGDYIDSRNQTSRKAATEAAADLFAANGGAGEVISLPEDHGVFGNTHLLMQDNNSEFIGSLVINWLNRNAAN